MKTKKPTPAQLKILQQMNEDICILKQPKDRFYPQSISYYDYTNRQYRHLGSITNKSLELLIFNEWVKIDHEKTSRNNYHYFITDKGKAILKND